LAPKAFGGWAKSGGSAAMSNAVFRPVLRKSSGRKKASASVKRSVERIGREEMIARRDHCMTTITRDRNEVDTNTFFAKARTLLTRHWYPASWRSRADILRNAEWLVRVGEKFSGAQPSRP
jgi:hypothetical protein